jgi:hypothetical protein
MRLNHARRRKPSRPGEKQALLLHVRGACDKRLDFQWRSVAQARPAVKQTSSLSQRSPVFRQPPTPMQQAHSPFSLGGNQCRPLQAWLLRAPRRGICPRVLGVVSRSAQPQGPEARSRSSRLGRGPGFAPQTTNSAAGAFCPKPGPPSPLIAFDIRASRWADPLPEYSVLRPAPLPPCPMAFQQTRHGRWEISPPRCRARTDSAACPPLLRYGRC